MPAVTRLLTVVDLDEAHDPGPDAQSMSVTARHEAVLADGRRIVLLADRGWTETQRAPWGDAPSGIWASETVEELERTARTVVGPDEPFEGRSAAEMEAGHWETLARLLQGQGVQVDAAELKALPHAVELSDRVLARVGRGAGSV